MGKLLSSDIDALAENVYSKKGRNATIWDVFVQLFAERGKLEPFIVWILSDFAIIELVAQGHTAAYIGGFLDVPEKSIHTTCEVWGIFPCQETLDFDPTQVYKNGMSVESFRDILGQITFSVPSNILIENIILNVERYRSVKNLPRS